MDDIVFDDRRHAGRVLAGLLGRHRGDPEVVVLALPRGGVPVGYEIAVTLGVPLDVLAVAKIGAPGHEELAVGAVARGSVVVRNAEVVRDLGLDDADVERLTRRAAAVVRDREGAYREGRPATELAGKTVILVDDGLATGASMRAAVQAVRAGSPARVEVAVPTGAPRSCRELAAEVDDVTCASQPAGFFAVGSSYRDFGQTTDREVHDLLRAARDHAQRRPGSSQ
jgi:predicted phosphoribosyltransferase